MVSLFFRMPSSAPVVAARWGRLAACDNLRTKLKPCLEDISVHEKICALPGVVSLNAEESLPVKYTASTSGLFEVIADCITRRAVVAIRGLAITACGDTCVRAGNHQAHVYLYEEPRTYEARTCVQVRGT